MSHEHEPNIHGELGDVIRQLLEEVSGGRMDHDQFVELVKGLNSQKSYDVSTTFRCALIAAGHEDMALRMAEIHMSITSAGALFQYVVRGDRPDWLDNLSEEQNAAIMRASICTLRAGNIDATECPEGGAIHINGNILGDDEQPSEDELVAEFLSELEAEYPSMPKGRLGKWW